MTTETRNSSRRIAATKPNCSRRMPSISMIIFWSEHGQARVEAQTVSSVAGSRDFMRIAFGGAGADMQTHALVSKD